MPHPSFHAHPRGGLPMWLAMLVALLAQACGASVLLSPDGATTGDVIVPGDTIIPGDAIAADTVVVTEAGFRCRAPDGSVLVPGQSYPVACNSCTCQADGTFACTRRACVDGGITPVDAGVACWTADGRAIPVGSSFFDGCNTCSCQAIPGGATLACTARACPDGGTDAYCMVPGGGRIRVGDSYSLDGCNTCTCLAGGNVVCTAIPCVTDAAVMRCVGSDGRLYSPGDNVPTSRPCTVCTCSRDGTISCLATPCPPPDSGVLRWCSSIRDCASGEYCDIEAGSCWTDAIPGVCRPGACTRDVAPYCGCDGATLYGSSSCPPGPFQYRGECMTTPPDAGPSACMGASDCGWGRICIFGEGCGTPGTCAAGLCTADVAPFCSCSGTTVYGSSSCPPEPFAYRGACRADGGAGDVCIGPGGVRIPIGTSYSDGCTSCSCYSGIAGPALVCSGACVDGGSVDASIDAGPEAGVIGIECRLTNLSCLSLPPTCPAGEVPVISSTTRCWRGCMALSLCGTLSCEPGGAIWQCPWGTECNRRSRTCVLPVTTGSGG